MTPTDKKTSLTKGFAIPLLPDTELGLAMLIAEDEEGYHEPVSVVGTIGEAEQIAKDDFRNRMRGIETGECQALCPLVYKLWARGIGGVYQLAHEINVA
jgi:hypothetical protein